MGKDRVSRRQGGGEGMDRYMGWGGGEHKDKDWGGLSEQGGDGEEGWTGVRVENEYYRWEAEQVLWSSVGGEVGGGRLRAGTEPRMEIREIEKFITPKAFSPSHMLLIHSMFVFLFGCFSRGNAFKCMIKIIKKLGKEG